MYSEEEYSQLKLKNEELECQLMETQQALKDAQRMRDAQTRFLADMAHEMRTSIHGVIGVADYLLSDSQLQQKVVGFVSGMKTAAAGMLELINDVLDISRIEAGNMEIAVREYAVRALYDEVIELIYLFAKKKKILLFAEIDPELPELLIGDRKRIKQLLLNLLSNGIKYTEEGFVRLEIKGKEENGEYFVTFSVTDSGIGIREEDKRRLFEPYVRLDKKRNKRQSGVGLGLPLCKKLVDLMNGRFSVESKYGAGSRFSFTIKQIPVSDMPLIHISNKRDKKLCIVSSNPHFIHGIERICQILKIEDFRYMSHEMEMDSLEYCSHVLVDASGDNTQELLNNSLPAHIQSKVIYNHEEVVGGGKSMCLQPISTILIGDILNNVMVSPTSSSIENIRKSVFLTKNVRALVVDDNQVNLVVAKNLLWLFQIEVDVALSGVEAIDMIKNQDYDVVLIDYMMPHMDGAETIRAIRSMGPQYEDMTIVMLSASVDLDSMQEFSKINADGKLDKPLELRKLAELLEQVIPEAKKVRETIQVEESKLTEDVKVLFKNVVSIDLEDGFARSLNQLDNYMQVIESCVGSLDKKLNQLQRAYIKKSSTEFRIIAHSFKGVMGNIGAHSIADFAAKMEEAALVGNNRYIDSHLERFIHEIRSLQYALEEVMKLYNKLYKVQGIKIGELQVSEETMRKYNQELVESIQAYDYSEAMVMIEMLLTCDSSHQELLLEVKQHLSDFDYSKANHLLTEISVASGQNS